jgi:hypothetical protein
MYICDNWYGLYVLVDCRQEYVNVKLHYRQTTFNATAAAAAAAAAVAVAVCSSKYLGTIACVE